MRKCSLSTEWTPPDSKYCIEFFFFCKACGILIPQPEIIPGRLAVRAQSPNHWTARVSPISVEFNNEQVKLRFHPESQTVFEDGVSGNYGSKQMSQGRRDVQEVKPTGSAVRLRGILIQAQSSGRKETKMRMQLCVLESRLGRREV